MGQKQIKAIKREQRRILKGYLSEFAEYIQPKPRYIPWSVWRWMQKKVLKMDKINPMMK